ncbi:hypothetical protein TRAPUB_7869 [Trametes pubescens]|uniref:Uncharacterized protein n=1 Tax=Trametes pubescens TaxID=154538 RepID=A0A1M2V274_TRAPU|nr:hypothetical protein TRAPUB_7869 [Trametes pubescens]
MQFWAYFEEHARSREGESHNEHVWQVEDLERQLQAVLVEGHALCEERARFMEELEQQLCAAREESTMLCRDRDRYRSECDQAREQVHEKAQLRARASQSRPNQARRLPPVPLGHPDFPESPERMYPVRLSRSARDASPHQSTYQSSGMTSGGHSQARDKLMLLAGPSRTMQSTLTETPNAGPSRTPHQAQMALPPSSPPEPLGSASRHPATGQGPTVDFQDFDEMSSSNGKIVDERYIQKKTNCRRHQQAIRGEPGPPPPRPADFSADGRSPHPPIQGWPYLNLGQARNRIRHLLQQVQDNSALQGVRGINVLVDAWWNPDKCPYLPTIMHPAAYNPPGLEPADMLNLPPPLGRRAGGGPRTTQSLRPVQDLTGPRRIQPQTIDPPEVHRDWWRSYQDQIPTWMERDQDGGPLLVAAQLFIFARQPLAHDRSVPERGH